MNLFPLVDWIAFAGFVAAWSGYAIAMEWSPHGKDALNVRMHEYREVWMRRALARDMRMVDTMIMSSLQNGTAFFASTSLLAVGGALSILRSTDDMLAMIGDLPLGIHVTRGQWEVKTIGLVIILVYAFFKFAWSYRLFNYVAILLGAMPPASAAGTPEAEAHIRRTARLLESAGRHFNRGQRALFFALGYLGWFAGPYAFMISTAATVVVMWRRQFASESRRAVVDG
jgi:uncharacterized membrane protein